MIIKKEFLQLLSILLLTQTAFAQTDKNRIDFETYNPPSSLIVPSHSVAKAKFPFIDVHNHQGNMPSQNLSALVQEMDKLNMKIMVNLSGKGGNDNHLKQSLENIKKTAPSRLIVFTNVSFNDVGAPDWAKKAVKALEEDVKAGAKGLKVFKSLGLSNKDNKGNILRVDDSRLDPIWEKCGQLGIPVLIHTADPKQFWQDADGQNERWLELLTRPGRKRSNTDPASWEELIRQQHNVFRKHKNTIFIAAHFGWFANDLNHLGTLLNSMPNVNIEFGAVIAEIGRQPRMAKQFFTKYQDRILFGKDSWVPSEYPTYFRVLETEDEYFPYHKKYHAYWKMYGLGLSDEILKKVYYKNAIRIIPGIDKNLFPK